MRFSKSSSDSSPAPFPPYTVVRKGKVRRAKLFYLRGRTGKAAKVKSDI